MNLLKISAIEHIRETNGTKPSFTKTQLMDNQKKFGIPLQILPGKKRPVWINKESAAQFSSGSTFYILYYLFRIMLKGFSRHSIMTH